MFGAWPRLARTNRQNNMNIHPSVLTDSVEVAHQQLSMITNHSDIEVVQVDIIDGLFANNITLTPADVPPIEAEYQLDFHLMTQEPMDYVYELAGMESFLNVRAVIAQVERMSSQAEFLEEVAKHGWKAGLSLDLFTPLEAIDDASWGEVAIVQLMAIEAGFQGQSFDDRVFAKIAELVAKRTELGREIEIIIDGGVKLPLLEKIAEAQVDGAVVGSGIWAEPDPDEALIKYLEMA